MDDNILKLADFSEKFSVGKSSAYLIVNKKMVDRPCMFGFMELEDDSESVKALFEKIFQKAKELGYQNIIGPINYSTWFSYRITISGFDIKLFPDCDNPQYYAPLLKTCGLNELYTYRSASIKLTNNPLLKMANGGYQKNLKRGIEFKTFHGNDAKAHIKEIYDISIAAFDGSRLYSPISYEEFSKLYLTWTDFIFADLYIAYQDNQAVGFVFGYKNPHGEQFIVKTVAVLPEFQGQKIYLSLMYLCYKDLLEKGYESAVAHFQCEQREGFMRFPSKFEFDEKRYAIYIKEL